MSATRAPDFNTLRGPVLYLAFELGRNTWKLTFTMGAGQKPRRRTLGAGNLEGAERGLFGVSWIIRCQFIFPAGEMN